MITNRDKGDPQTYAIIGAAYEVHNQLGNGFLEAVYQAALEIELTKRNIPYQCQVNVPIFYKGTKLDCTYRSDLVCFEDILIELKAIKAITDIEVAQTINYLKATGMHRGLLINFGSKRLTRQRFVNGAPVLEPLD